MIKEHIDRFGEFEIYEGYLIGRIDEGVNAGSDFVDALSELIQKHFHGRPVIYISDRVNSFSLDPVATTDLIARNNICFAGVVAYTQQQKSMYPMEEKLIAGINICCFDSLGTAVAWAEQKMLDIN